MKSVFTKKLSKWHRLQNTRSMPWKGEKDPYRIWLSEIILQQTRVEQGMAYYNKFVSVYPSIRQLAMAPEQEVFKLWEGLGYYSRCKNLIATAKFVSSELNGRFPDKYEEVRALKGIGPYTAAAISSFAYNLPYAVVDGNVLRVISRYFGINTPVDTTEGKKLYNFLADALLDKKQPALYNQAIMDFGAVICKAQLPLCSVCVQRKDCHAYTHNLVKQLPVKEKSRVKKTRWFYYFVVEYKNFLYIRKRSTKDIWENLYEFVLKESDGELVDDRNSLKSFLQSLVEQDQVIIHNVSRVYRQQLSHQTIVGQFINVKINKPAFMQKEYEAVLKNDLDKYPFPKIINAWLSQNEPV
ncbi:MAG: A/G-specific adenine glycosylase [Chitinophagaceae bacterium]